MKRRARLAALAMVAVLGLRLGIGHVVGFDRALLVRPDESREIVDRHGEPLRYVRAGDADHVFVPFDRIAPTFVRALVAAEDARFFEHDGVDDRALVRALASHVLPLGRRSGGSTITQQLVKLVRGRPHGLLSKPSEMVLALALETGLSKRRIFEEYANRLPFGNGIVGVERASRVYFGKGADELTLDEAALLAGIPQAPSVTEPRRHLARALERRRYVLSRLGELGLARDDELRAAAQAIPAIRAETPRPYRAPRFVDRVLEGFAARPPESRTFRTSLDLPLQRETESLLRAAVDRGAPRGVTNAAGLVLRVASGEVLAYVGAARDAASDEAGAMDLLRRRRHPGSTLKPFAYELFFEQGGTAATPLEDRLRPMTLGDGELYDARNFDGEERGRVSARRALAASLNLAALDVARRVGATRLVSTLRTLGFGATVDETEHGAGVVLGGVSASPFELARAYLVLARGGTAVEPSSTPVDAREGTRSLDPDASALVTDVLSDPDARRLGFGDDLRTLSPAAPFALKTGTSPAFRDAWAAVYDAELLVVVWVGDPRGRPLDGVAGFVNAAPTAVSILEAARGRLDDGALGPRRPAPRVELASVRVCEWTGQRALPTCPSRLERFAHGHGPLGTCSGVHDEPATGLDVARSEEGLVLVEPRDGAELYVQAGRPAPAIPIRTRVPGGRRVRVRVDGRESSGATWLATPGAHVVEAFDDEGHVARARVEVVEVGGG